MSVSDSAARRWLLALTVLLAGGFLPPVDFFIVNVTLPSIHLSLGAPAGRSCSLVIGVYASGYAVFMITGGRLGDLYGRRLLFLIGMAGFTITNLLCGLAATPLQLLLGRALQGICAALLVPQVLGAIRALCTNDRDLARAMSAYGVTMGLAAVTGQFAGGALVQWSPFDLGWRTVFLLKLPVCLLVWVAAWFLVPETSATSRAKLDLPGAAMISVILACVIVPVSEGRDQNWPLWVFAVLATVPFLVAVFLRYEARLGARRRHAAGRPGLVRHPELPPRRAGRDVVLLHDVVLFFIRSLSAGGAWPRSAAYRACHRAVRDRIVPRSAGQRVAGAAASEGCSRSVWESRLPGMPRWPDWLPGEPISRPCWPRFSSPDLARGSRSPDRTTRSIGRVPPHQAGLAAGIVNSALQVGAAVSAAAIGSLFFTLLGSAHGERDYGFAFAIAQMTLTAALFAAMLIAIPRRREMLLTETSSPSTRA